MHLTIKQGNLVFQIHRFFTCFLSMQNHSILFGSKTILTGGANALLISGAWQVIVNLGKSLCHPVQSGNFLILLLDKHVLSPV